MPYYTMCNIIVLDVQSQSVLIRSDLKLTHPGHYPSPLLPGGSYTPEQLGIRHRCAKILLAMEHKMQFAYHLRKQIGFRCALNLVSLASQFKLFIILLLISKKNRYRCHLITF